MSASPILCAVDFSAGAEAAALVAGELARQGDRALVLAHVVRPPQVSFGVPAPTAAAMRASFVEGPAAHLAALRARLAARGVAADTAVAEGAPWKQIVRLASDRGAGLIVLGAHGQSSLTDALLGTVAERVVRHAPCSVLVVRPDATPVPG